MDKTMEILKTLRNERARRYRYISSTESIHEVHSAIKGAERIVDLDKKTCTCLEWQLTGYPCAHALCVMLGRKLDASHYTEQFHHLAAYRATYSGVIVHPNVNDTTGLLDFRSNPVCRGREPLGELSLASYLAIENVEEANDDESVDSEDNLLPPSTKRPAGRPKKRRIRHEIEREPKRIQKCSRCREVGHSRRTCKEAI